MKEVPQVPSKARPQPATRLWRKGNKDSVASKGLAMEGHVRNRALHPIDGHFPPVQNLTWFQQLRKSLPNDYNNAQIKSKFSMPSKRPARHMGVICASSSADVMHPVSEMVMQKGWGWTSELSGDKQMQKKNIQPFR